VLPTGPTSILVAQILESNYLPAIMVAAYSIWHSCLHSTLAIRLVTTKNERKIRMPYNPKNVTQTAKIIFPIAVTIISGLIAPASLALVGFLMFGNLLKECGVLKSLSETASNTLVNLITLLLGITISFKMTAMNS
jgi:oxaloacetate decarboxylase beta subunit